MPPISGLLGEGSQKHKQQCVPSKGWKIVSHRENIFPAPAGHSLSPQSKKALATLVTLWVLISQTFTNIIHFPIKA